MAWFGAPQQEGVDKDGGAGEDERRLEAAAAAGERVVQQVRRRPERVARLPAGRLGAGRRFRSGAGGGSGTRPGWSWEEGREWVVGGENDTSGGWYGVG